MKRLEKLTKETLLGYQEVGYLLAVNYRTAARLPLGWFTPGMAPGAKRFVRVEKLLKTYNIELDALAEPMLCAKEVWAKLGVSERLCSEISPHVPWVQLSPALRGRRLPHNKLSEVSELIEKTAQRRAISPNITPSLNLTNQPLGLGC